MKILKQQVASTYQDPPSTVKEQVKKYAADQQLVEQPLSPWKRYSRARVCLYLKRSESCKHSQEFLVAIHGNDNQMLKEQGKKSIDSFELWYWERLTRILCSDKKETNGKWSQRSLEVPFEAQMIRIILSCFRHTVGRSTSLEKALELGKMEQKRTRGQPEARQMD